MNLTELAASATVPAAIQLNVNYNQVMAGAVFGALPLALMFILLQRNFVRGVVLTGLREA